MRDLSIYFVLDRLFDCKEQKRFRFSYGERKGKRKKRKGEREENQWLGFTFSSESVKASGFPLETGVFSC